jgi:hypothetical protein
VEYERELVVRTAGALPVVAKLAEKLGLVEVVDRFCPIRSVAEYTHGQVVLALVANRLNRVGSSSPVASVAVPGHHMVRAGATP